LNALGVVVVYRAKQEVFGAGSEAAYCYKVLGGGIRVLKLCRDGRRQILQFLLPGDLLAFDSGDLHATTAEAMNRATLLRFPRRRMEALLESDGVLGLEVRRTLSLQLLLAQRHVVMLGRKSADERVASFLLLYAERQIQAAAASDRPMVRQDIADYLGLSGETVSRVLNQMKREGIVDLPTASPIRILDTAALAALDGHDWDAASEAGASML
jgi:CRP-like cAMP-binding protein